MTMPIRSFAPALRATKATGHTGLSAGTLVLTMAGEVPVEKLVPGDRIITRDSGVALLRGLREISFRAEAIRIRAGAFGKARPEAEMTLPPAQEVLVRDWRAETLFGTSQALVDVGRLADGEGIVNLGDCDFTTWELVFDRCHILYAGGMEVSCGTPSDADS